MSSIQSSACGFTLTGSFWGVRLMQGMAYYQMPLPSLSPSPSPASTPQKGSVKVDGQLTAPLKPTITHVNICLSTIAEALVRPFVIIIMEIVIKANPGILRILEVLQINILIFDIPPKTFDKMLSKACINFLKVAYSRTFAQEVRGAFRAC